MISARGHGFFGHRGYNEDLGHPRTYYGSRVGSSEQIKMR